MVTDAMESTHDLLDQLHVHTHETENEGIGSSRPEPNLLQKSPILNDEEKHAVCFSEILFSKSVLLTLTPPYPCM